MYMEKELRVVYDSSQSKPFSIWGRKLVQGDCEPLDWNYQASFGTVQAFQDQLDEVKAQVFGKEITRD